MKYIISALLLICSMQVSAGEWKPVHQATVTGLLVVDWAQTRDIARRPDIIEMNPILGENPSINKVNQYFLGSAVLFNTAMYFLPEDHAKKLAYVVGGVQILAIGNNVAIGVKLDF